MILIIFSDFLRIGHSLTSTHGLMRQRFRVIKISSIILIVMPSFVLTWLLSVWFIPHDFGIVSSVITPIIFTHGLTVSFWLHHRILFVHSLTLFFVLIRNFMITIIVVLLHWLASIGVEILWWHVLLVSFKFLTSDRASRHKLHLFSWLRSFVSCWWKVAVLEDRLLLTHLKQVFFLSLYFLLQHHICPLEVLDVSVLWLHYCI